MPTCPVCQTSFDQKVDQPAPQTTPSIPAAYDMPSLIAAVQLLTQGYNQITGRAGGVSGFKSKSNSDANNKKPNPGRFIEQRQSRVTETHKVFSKQDPTTFVEFKQINSMTFKDSVTGELWTWTR